LNGRKGTRRAGKRPQAIGQGVERSSPACLERGRDRIRAIGRLEDGVDHEALVSDADRIELAGRSRNLAQRGSIGPGDEHEGGLAGVGEGIDRGGKARLLHLQAGVRPQARRAVRRRLEKARPRAREREQTQRVARGRGVEEHVIERHGRRLAGEELGELVERGDLHRARAGELLAQLGDLRLVPHGAIRCDHALAVGVGRLLRIDVERPQAFHSGDRRWAPRKLRAEHLAEVRRGIGADEEDSLARVREADRRRAGQRGLADATLAREEEKSGRIFEEGRHGVAVAPHASANTRRAFSRKKSSRASASSPSSSTPTLASLGVIIG
jgi:hypothetical protein